jgi:hypothetical protein
MPFRKAASPSPKPGLPWPTPDLPSAKAGLPFEKAGVVQAAAEKFTQKTAFCSFTAVRMVIFRVPPVVVVRMRA